MIDEIITLLRMMIRDVLQSGTDIYTYTTSNVFTLSESNTQEITDVAVNDVISGATYSYNQTLQKVTVSAPALVVDDIVEINYTFFSNYSDTELEGYIKHALTYISVNRYMDFQLMDDDNIYPTPSLAEQNLIATIAAIIINPENASYKTPDFSIVVKNPMSTADMISKTIAIFKKSPIGLFTIV